MMRALSVTWTLALMACAVDGVEEEAGPSPEVEVDEVAARCPLFGCGVNTATGPDGQFFDTLDWTGTYANHAGVRIESATLNGRSVKLKVELDRLVAFDPLGTRYDGAALKNLMLRMATPSGPFDVWFYNVGFKELYYWAGDKTDDVPVYDMLVKKDGGQWGWACREPVSNWTGRSYSAVLFEGDTYDAKYKKVHDSSGTTWFQLACAGSYEAKLHLNRHTRAGGFDRFDVLRWPTTIAQRQTYLKAITADYRGDGTSYTVPGTVLKYTDAKGIRVEDVFTGAYREAIWNENGAVCLDRPRRADRTWFPDIPWCPPGDWKNYGYVITAAP